MALSVLLNGTEARWAWTAGYTEFRTLQIVSTTTNTYDTTSIKGLDSGLKWVGGVLGLDGRIYGMPCNADAVLIVNTTSSTYDITSIKGLSSSEGNIKGRSAEPEWAYLRNAIF